MRTETHAVALIGSETGKDKCMKKGSLTIVFTFFTVAVLQAGFAAGATLTVNDNLAGIVCNQTLSLKEATEFARDGSTLRNLTDGEKNQIGGANWVALPPDPNCAGAIWRAAPNGGVGRNFADDIFFTNAVTQINDFVLLGRNDDINGLKPNGTKVILDGTGVGGSGTSGISFSDPSTDPSGSQVRNLTIRNYQASGMVVMHADGAILEGLEIFNNGQHGIYVGPNFSATQNSRNLRIGGDQPQHRNLIYSNGLDGIAIVALPNNDRFPNQGIDILNNYIGTQNGTTDNGNNRNGIYLENAFGVIIGDATGATRNIISGNNGDGVKLVGEKTVSNEVIGNFIGTDLSGGSPLGNSDVGITLVGGVGAATDYISQGPNRIGRPGLGNVISSNQFGMFISDNNTSKNVIEGNRIGTNVGGNSNLGNTADGIFIGAGTSDNIVGGSANGAGNLIAFNRAGIRADNGIRNRFQQNRIFSNTQLGIDLGTLGVTPNDPGDGDTGANGLLNFPVITYVNAQNSSVRIEGTYNSAPNQTYTLEFFGNTAVDPTGYGEGRNFLGQTSVTTDGSGNASFNVEYPVNIASTGTWVTATATDSNNNTSEYSLARNICSTIRLTPTGIIVASGGGSSSFTVQQSVGCGGFTPVPSASWINVTSSSAGTVNFTVAANTGAQRSGTISVNFNNGQFITFANFNITQLAFNCAYSLSPSNTSLPDSGGATSFNVTTSASCNWTATSNATWITVTGGASGSGNGSVTISVAQNSGPPRTGTVSIGSETFTVNQGGCSYALGSASINLGALGDSSFSFAVFTSASGCTWSATSNDSWITIEGGTNRVGTGTVVFTVSSSQGQSRTGTISAAGLTFTVNQTPSCVYSVNPASQTIPASGGGGSFAITAPSGCGWLLVSPVSWLNIINASRGSGNGTVNFSVGSYSGGNGRGAIFFLNDTSFQVLQQTNCTFDTSITSASFGTNGGSSSFNVTNAVPCNWLVAGSPNWITITSPTSNTDNQTVTFSVAPNTTGTPRTGTIQILLNAQTVKTVNISQAGASAIFDFDGDGKTDISIFRPSGADGAEWWWRRSSDGLVPALQFGSSTDVIAPGDFTGDGKMDITIFRPSSGTWFVLRSEDYSFFSFPFGAAGDVPVTGDYDGDGRADPAVFRASVGQWFIQRSSDNQVQIVQFGIPGDVPVNADYDGDGIDDIGIYRPNGANGGEWWINRSTAGPLTLVFGSSTDKTVPGDYTGDGKADIAFFRPSNGNWFVLRSEDSSFFSFPFGANGDVPSPGDYDGDGKIDAAVFRPLSATWFIQGSTSGTTIQQFGAAGDVPVPNAFVR